MPEKSLVKIEHAFSDQVALTGSIREALAVGEYDSLEKLFVAQDMGLQYLLALQGRISHTIALGLYSLRELWDEIDMDFVQRCWKESPWCPKERFNYTFEQYATGRTNRKWVTVENWIRTARVWLSGEFEENFPEKVQLIDPKTGEKCDTIDFDPWKIDASKLLLCNRALIKGEMTEDAWGLLSNPEASFSDITTFINLGQEPSDRYKELQISAKRWMFIRGGLLLVQEVGGEPEKVAELEWGTKSDLVEWALIQLYDRLNLTVED